MNGGARRKDRWSIAPPGGESFASRVDPVRAFLTNIRPHTVLVSHSGIIRIIAHLLTGLAPERAVALEVPHVGVHSWDGNRMILAQETS